MCQLADYLASLIEEHPFKYSAIFVSTAFSVLYFILKYEDHSEEAEEFHRRAVDKSEMLDTLYVSLMLTASLLLCLGYTAGCLRGEEEIETTAHSHDIESGHPHPRGLKLQ